MTPAWKLFLIALSLLAPVAAAAEPLPEGSANKAAPDSLAAGFEAPPLQARTRAYWWWLNSHVTRSAITRDLEWMHEIGMGGGLLFDAGSPAGPIPTGPLYASAQWRELFRFALHEADRLGLELTLNPQSGWNLGGPCVTPDMAGKHVTWSQFQVTGPKKISVALPQPPRAINYYRDSFVVAYRLKLPSPSGRGAGGEGSAGVGWDKQTETLVGLRSRGIFGSTVDSESSPAGLRRPTTTTATSSHPTAAPAATKADGTPAPRANPRAGNKPLVGADRHRPIRDLADKSLFHELGGNAPDCSPLLEDVPAVPGEEDTAAKDVHNLTAHFKDSRLTWDVPPGRWQILRFGYTNNGGRVSTSSGQWKGLVVDYLDADALRAYWSAVVEPLIADAGPLAGRVLKGIQTDSWEGGGLNWTARMPEEFRRRRGYEIWPYLPVLAGAIVESRDASNRFLADFRKTIGECFSDNHYAVLQQLTARHGMYIHCEAGGPHAGPFDAMRNWSHCEMPMGEFWVYSPHRPTEESRFFMKGAASAAHVFGRKIACGEGFTAVGPHWNDVLWSSQRPTFDHEACAGMNLMYWHAFTSSPPEDGLPGQQYFAGTHFDPGITWARQAHAFIAYMNRCQWMLQQGQFVADVVYYNGDNVPNLIGRKQVDPAGVLPGYDYDVINEDVLLHRLTVHDGRLETPGGPSYRLLVLPKSKTMSLAAIKRIKELVEAGAKVCGPKPEKTVTLAEYPMCDEQLHSIAGSLWDSRAVGTKPATEVLRELNVLPDIDTKAAALDYIHHRDGRNEIYFLSNPKGEPVAADVAFRVSAMQPELWDPMSGTHRAAAAFRQDGEQTRVPLEFGPYGSVFVVFRRPLSDDIVEHERKRQNYPSYSPVAKISGPWTVSFDPKWGGPETVNFDKLVSWTDRKEEGIRYYSGTATYRAVFDRPAGEGRIALDLGRVANIAEVRLNGKDLGVVWAPPFRVEITKELKPSGNRLEIDVVNTWYNRVALDSDLPPAKRLTHTNVQLPKGTKPLESGLLGPLRLMRISADE